MCNNDIYHIYIYIYMIYYEFVKILTYCLYIFFNDFGYTLF